MRFVLLKELHELVPGESVTATQVFSPDDEYLADHFPGFPVVPGTLITEALSQAGGWLIAATLGFARWPVLNMVEKAKFRRFLRPGEELQIRLTFFGHRRQGRDGVALHNLCIAAITRIQDNLVEIGQNFRRLPIHAGNGHIAAFRSGCTTCRAKQRECHHAAQ